MLKIASSVATDYSLIGLLGSLFPMNISNAVVSVVCSEVITLTIFCITVFFYVIVPSIFNLYDIYSWLVNSQLQFLNEKIASCLTKLAYLNLISTFGIYQTMNSEP